ncbi:MAG: transglutaminase-like domain-containing protein, partial [Acidobacteria bacterium]|nr:transglutaminase-like domain-containing protein [Acidobacteriota bacterium]
MPPIRTEPYMPPENETRAWMLVYDASALGDWNFWPRLGKSVYEENKSAMKVTDEVRAAAVSAVGDATTPEQKLERLFQFCRTKIKNFDYDPNLTEADMEKLKSNKSATETLKRGAGFSYDITLLFAALANSVGLDARIAQTGDRGDVFFDRSFPSPYFLSSYNVAVLVGDKWRFFDPSNFYTPFGMLRWQEEGIEALVSDPVYPLFVRTPISDPEKSRKIRTASMRLSEDGTLEGDVRIEYTGHFGVEQKEFFDGVSIAEREKLLRDGIKEWLTAAEVSDIKIENANDPLKPLVKSYHVRVPSYAQRTGKRLFLQPAFFQYGSKPMFTESIRKHPIYFH